MSIVVVGNTVVDLVFPGMERLPAWPRHTEFTPDNLVFSPKPPLVSLGGNGANAAYAAARCGAASALYTRVGTDALGGLARQWLEEAGCRVRGSGRSRTAVNLTVTNRRHERATLFYPGAPVAMPTLPAGKRAPSHLLVCGWPHPSLPRMAAGLRAFRRRGTFTALDAGPILGPAWTVPSLVPVLAALDLFIANVHEIRQIARCDSLAEALRRLRRFFPGQVVIKRGPKGALWLPAGSSQAQAVPCPRVKAINTVGVGDCFNGALLAALARGATAARVVASPKGILGI